MGVWLIVLIFYMRKIGKAIGRKRTSLDGKAEFRFQYIFAALAIALWFVWSDIQDGRVNEILGIAAVFLVACYRGEKGRPILPRRFFYWFYPVHITLLGIILHLVREQALFDTVSKLAK